MINKLIGKLDNRNVDNFTSNFGLWIRRTFHNVISFLFRVVIRFYYKKKIIVGKRPKLDKKKSYIYALNHSFYLDGSAVIASADKNCYALFGATEQLYFDVCTFFIWFSGLIYVDRTNKQSRKDSIPKMSRVLKAGNSVLIFPEGRWNDSENLLCQKLFAGVYNLSVENNVEVIPVSVFKETESKEIYVDFGDPMKLYEKDKDKALIDLRDNLATMYYDQIMAHSTPFKREEIDGDIHFNFMNDRMYEYSKAKWHSDYCWDEELFTYKGKDVDLDDVWKDIDKININEKNIHIFKDILKDLNRIKKYNFTDYMNENYRKKY
ncbi:MAG: 1-acyl-sn-glycerol-3-phosphate acyltransferase [Bacilli bacterium]|nr:1-acyl-sn-glycerol-3-phosphate acyltransferase [Bacilli bacterium]